MKIRGPGKLRRLLLVRNDGLGDLVLTLPALMAARSAFPNTRITAFVNRATADLLRNNPHVDDVLVDRPKASIFAVSQQLAAFAFDAALLFNTTNRMALATWLARVPIRVCWAGRAAGFLTGTRRVLVRRSHPPIHESEFAKEFVRKLSPGIATLDDTPRLDVDPFALTSVRQRLDADLGQYETLFAVHPGSHQSAYNWPLNRYVELVNRLLEKGHVVLTGSPAEQHLLNEVYQSIRPALRDRLAAYSNLSLTELVALLSLANSLTVSSTGPMHLAALVGTPTIALFSSHPAQSPHKWAPLGQRTTIFQAPLLPGERATVPSEKGFEHMERISVRSVVRANLEAVERRRDRISLIERRAEGVAP